MFETDHEKLLAEVNALHARFNQLAGEFHDFRQGRSWLNAEDRALLNEAVAKSKHLADAVRSTAQPPTGESNAIPDR